jgi:N-acetylneuraminic acid mutarotase
VPTSAGPHLAGGALLVGGRGFDSTGDMHLKQTAMWVNLSTWYGAGSEMVVALNSSASMPYAFQGAAVHAVGSSVYVVGGETDTNLGSVSTACHQLDLAKLDVNEVTGGCAGNSCWASCAKAPGGVAFAASTVVGHKIVVAGGRTDANSVTADVLIYDTTADAWTKAAPLQSPRLPPTALAR